MGLSTGSCRRVRKTRRESSMPRTRTSLVRVVAIVAIVCSLLVVAPAAGAQGPFQVVASGLDNPRGLAFAPDGSLLVAEAGRGGPGPCISGPEAGQVCYGPTGAVTRVSKGVQRRIVTGLPSLAGSDGMAATGPHDVLATGLSVTVVTGLGAAPNARDALGAPGMNFGRLLAANLSGGWRALADVSGYEAVANPDGGAIDTNPYGLAPAPGHGSVVADAGGNDLLLVPSGNRSIQTLAVFPNRLVPAPEFLGLPPGTMIPMQAVPDSVAVGPDGAYYVGQLTGFPFPVGGANVYRVVPGQAPTVYASGFTNIIDVTFDASGNLYVLEIAKNGLLSGDPTGALIKVAPDGTRTEIASEGLVAPGSVAVGPDGALYVSNFSIFPGMGEVVRIVPAPPA